MTRSLKEITTLKKSIRDVPDFPKKGIIFKDITPLLRDKKKFRLAIQLLAKPFMKKKIEAVVAIESRGFIFGAALAYALGCGFIPVRKKGKLPWKTYQATYTLEYGTDSLEIHQDALKKGTRVLLVDDLLATGGTMSSVVGLVEKMGAKIVGTVFLIELGFLRGGICLRAGTSIR
jgi:adenine phosphoribosyltransferase